MYLQISAGGSLSNSLFGLSRLGHADNTLRDSGELSIAMAGGIGSDSLGSFFLAQAGKAGVTLLSDCVPDSCTGSIQTWHHFLHWDMVRMCKLSVLLIFCYVRDYSLPCYCFLP